MKRKKKNHKHTKYSDICLNVTYQYLKTWFILFHLLQQYQTYARDKDGTHQQTSCQQLLTLQEEIQIHFYLKLLCRNEKHVLPPYSQTLRIIKHENATIAMLCIPHSYRKLILDSNQNCLQCMPYLYKATLNLKSFHPLEARIFVMKIFSTNS